VDFYHHHHQFYNYPKQQQTKPTEEEEEENKGETKTSLAYRIGIWKHPDATPIRL
jgi:hypothetical protein